MSNQKTDAWSIAFGIFWGVILLVFTFSVIAAISIDRFKSKYNGTKMLYGKVVHDEYYPSWSFDKYIITIKEREKKIVVKYSDELTDIDLQSLNGLFDIGDDVALEVFSATDELQRFYYGVNGRIIDVTSE